MARTLSATNTPVSAAATGSPGATWSPETAQPTHTAARTATARRPTRGCRAATVVRRPTAHGRQTTTPPARTTATTTTPVAAHVPSESLTTPTPEPIELRSVTRSNGRSSTTNDPRSRTFSRVRAPRRVPTRTVIVRTHGVGRAERAESTSASPATTRPSTGIRRKATGVSRSGRFGATSANHTRATASTVARAATPVRGLSARRPVPRRGRRRHSHHTSRPNDSVSERHGEDRRDDRHRVRQHVRGRDGEGDAHRRRHHLAPVAELERLAQPGQHPPGHGEGVPREPARQHPPPGRRRDDDAEHEDEERVHLPVEAPPERRHRAGAPGDPTVGGIEDEGRDGQHEHGGRDRPAEQRLHRQRGHRAGQQPPTEGHEVRRAERLTPGA